MEMTLEEARRVFGITGAVGQDKLDHLLVQGQNKMLAAYFALTRQPGQTDATAQAGLGFAATFQRDIVCGDKLVAMEAFVLALGDHLAACGLSLPEPDVWRNERMLASDKQRAMFRQMLKREMPSNLPADIAKAFATIEANLDIITGKVISRLLDVVKALKEAKSWPK